MQKLLTSLHEEESWKESLRKSCKLNSIKTSFASILTPLKIRPLYERLLKTYSSNQSKAKVCWFQNELRAFHWVLIGVSWVQNIRIADFGDKEWEILLDIFKGKQLYVLKYEAIRVNGKKSRGNNPWLKEQQQILKSVINEKKEANKWNDIARSLFKQSGTRFYRTGKQCRQRWFNHLDPLKKHGNWTKREDQFIARYILQNGKKWSQIARTMDNSRTQHMVKNRFKSIIIQQKKYHPKLHQENELLQSILQDSDVMLDDQISIMDHECYSKNPSDSQISSNSYKKYFDKDYQKPELLTNHKIENSQDWKISQEHMYSAYPLQNLTTKSLPKQRQEQNIRNTSLQLKYLSPICATYTPQNSGTPIYKTPSPSMPFFMNAASDFAQSFSRFKMVLNSNEEKIVSQQQ